MAAYLERFEELLNEVGGQSEASLISFFIGGLKPKLKCELNICQPTSLWKAFSLESCTRRNVAMANVAHFHRLLNLC